MVVVVFEARLVGMRMRVDHTIVIVFMLVLHVVVILCGVCVGVRAVRVLVRVGVRVLVGMCWIGAHDISWFSRKFAEPNPASAGSRTSSLASHA